MTRQGPGEASDRAGATSSRRLGFRRFWWKTVRPFWVSVRWPVLSALALVALALGYYGFDSYFDARGVDLSAWDKLYFSLQLFGLQSGAVGPSVPATLQVARLLAPLVVAQAAISALAAIFRDQIAQARVRWFARDHVVVCGLGRAGHLLAHGFRDTHRVVAIERNANNEAVGECREGGVSVLIGDATDRTLLAKARVDRARYLFAVSDDDGANARVAIDARDIVEQRRRGAPLSCFVQIIDVDLAELLDAEMASRGHPSFRLEFFNPSERGAPALLNQHPAFDDEGNTALGRPHVLLVGMGQMGSRLVLHAARRWRAIGDQDGPPLRLTVVDRDATGHVDSLSLRHPQLAKVCEFTAHPMEVDSPEFERAEFLFDLEGRHVTGVYICLDDDARGMTAGLRLARQLRGRRVPIVVRTKQLGGLGTLLGDATGAYEDLRVFGVLDTTCRPDVILGGRHETLARAIHEEYVRKRAEEGETPQTNASMAPWHELAEDLKESSRRHADDIGNKLRTIGCDIERLTDWSPDNFRFEPGEIELLSQQEHDRWLRERLGEGWSYGPERDDDARVHPALLTWPKLTQGERIERYGREGSERIGEDELPEEEKKKDRELVIGIPAFLAKAGLRAVRLEGRR